MTPTRFLKFLFFLLLFTACKKESDHKLKIAVAANMQFAIKEICAVFTNSTNIKCDIITGSSGKLTTQIAQGAPYNIFLSADIKFPNYLYQNGLTNDKPNIYALGSLIIWSNSDNTSTNLKSLNNNNIKHIAIANPKTAPYGIAAIEVLKQIGIYANIKSKLVFGENISQVNQFILSETAQIGFTSKSIVPFIKNNEKGNYTEINQELYSPIKQGVVVINQTTKETEKSIKFKQFLTSGKVNYILKKYGYLPVNNN